MDGNRKNFFKRPSPQFKKKGGTRKGMLNGSVSEQGFENSHTGETEYKILCQSRKIGSVIGKGGNIIKSLREETQAKITVEDPVPGSDERVIIIRSSAKSVRKPYKESSDEKSTTQNEDMFMDPHCAAQDALLRVHDRIVEEDLVGKENDLREEIVVTARLLVPNNMVGCLLGHKGDVIQRLRRETGANIRVLPAEHLPTCAMSTDELVQISGKTAVTKQALYQISTLLHENPRKDKPPTRFSIGYGAHDGYHPPGPPLGNVAPPGGSMWSEPSSMGSQDMSPLPFTGGYSYQPLAPRPRGNEFPPQGGEATNEFTMKILCAAGKIGGVIGKGGFNVRQLQQETGASIHVEDGSSRSEDRIIRVSAFESIRNPRSQTIDAVLQLQNQTSEPSEKGSITTRLLVPSSKVGCILGQGGQVINEMRRRTQADIRVFSKEDKPKCASADEELVQISGSFGVAKDALVEISLRLRTRCLRDATAKEDPASMRPDSGFHAPGNLPGGRAPPLDGRGAGSSGKYDLLRGDIREYGSPSYSMFANAPRSLDMKIPSNPLGSAMGGGRSDMAEIVGMRDSYYDRLPGGPEGIAEYRRSAELLNPSQGIFHGYASPVGQDDNLQGVHQRYNIQHSHHTSSDPPQIPYQEDFTSPHRSYQSFRMPPASYQNYNAQGSYPY